MVILKDLTHKLKRLDNLVQQNKQHHRKVLLSGFNLKWSHFWTSVIDSKAKLDPPYECQQHKTVRYQMPGCGLEYGNTHCTKKNNFNN